MAKAKTTIVQTTKALVGTMPLTQINVTTIMKQAGLRRQTFYDYYRDKYDVLGDIYRTEIDADVWYCGDYRRWPQTVHAMLAYFDANRDFYRQALQLDEQNAPETYIRAHLEEMCRTILRDLQHAEQLALSADYQQFLAAALADMSLGVLRRFLLTAPAEPVAVVERNLSSLIADNLAGLKARTGH
ncbi:TetR/AcrR family transcriptional regulator C-terminal domain-containing protein [Lacticaseibacillus salsurivasis]|uniref:TetR/AcrR family transcriptional regulator C-terminal domain-containing protein n=1 Tax=Lacticaseibacillus salsurivasis TaxID=3081441 RepID=UPI0030C6DBF5